MRYPIVVFLISLLSSHYLFAAIDSTQFNINKASIRVNYTVRGTTHTVTTTWDKTLDNEDIYLPHAFKQTGDGALVFASIRAKQDIIITDFEINLPETLYDTKAIFCNGFQSWTTSKEYGLNDKIPRISWLGKLFAGHYGDYNFYKYPAKRGYLHGWAYTYLRKNNGQMVFTGSVSELSGYTLFAHNTHNGTLTIAKDCNGLALKADGVYDGFRLFVTVGTDAEVFNKYQTNFAEPLTKWAATKGVTLNNNPAPPAVGWSSWYNYYNKISEDTILGNLNNFRHQKTPIGVFQIDDGYQLSTGDWLHTNARFKGGMKPIADSIHAAGYKAGIWLAPFICEKKSFIYASHPDWLLKDSKGKPIVVGINPLWSGNYYALDIYQPAVQQYLKGVFDTVLRQWKYDLVKLDFLFAVALNPPKDKTRGQVMSEAMLLLRQWVGNDKLIDGCGAPMGPAFVLTDYCRISSDIHTNWEQKLLKALKARERLSVWNSLTGAIGRWQLAGTMFGNDPDVYLLRNEKNHLSANQKHTMQLVDNLFGKLVLMSDNISTYDTAQIAQYLSGFPFVVKHHLMVQGGNDFYQARFDVDGRNYLAIINLSGCSKEYVLDSNTYFNNHLNSITKPNASITIKPYQSLCLYQIKGAPFEVLGGTNSLFSGSEVASFELKNDRFVQITFKEKYYQKGAVVVKVPNEFNEMRVNNKNIKAERINGVNCLLYLP